MKVGLVKDALGASIIAGEENIDVDVEHIYASDLMSDVLAFGKPNSILLTGLATQQAIISAHMAEFKAVVLIRGKKPKDSSGQFARDNNLVLLSTDLDMYDACIRIETAINGKGKSAEKTSGKDKTGDLILSNELFIEGNDFANAGMVSTEVKSILKKIGFDPKLVRKVAISAYEAEMNVVMHAVRAKVFLHITPSSIEVFPMLKLPWRKVLPPLPKKCGLWVSVPVWDYPISRGTPMNWM